MRSVLGSFSMKARVKIYRNELLSTNSSTAWYEISYVYYKISPTSTFIGISLFLFFTYLYAFINPFCIFYLVKLLLLCILSYFVSWYFVYFHELCFFMFWLLKLSNFPTFVINKVFLILVLISTLSDYGMECWSCAAILLWSSTWLIEWGLSGESWIISAEASWLGLAGALMMWYHSEPGPSVFVSECGCICLCVRKEMRAHMHTRVCSRTSMCAFGSVRMCVCLLPSAPSNRLIFHILHGQEGQEAARLRPEPGYSTVSNARHSLAPPKLSALLPNALAS